MTVSSEDNLTEYQGDGALVAFTYAYLVFADEDVVVYLNSVKQSTGYSIVRNVDDLGGVVTFDLAPADGDLVTIRRIVPFTQEIDYVPYDAFPAETHERGLDRLTMETQQLSTAVRQAISIPESEDPSSVNVIVPPKATRAEKFIYFDVDGNVTALAAEIDVPAVYRVDVQDGSGGHDSRKLLQVEAISGGASYPKIGFTNVNQAGGPVQLNSQGHVPDELLTFSSLQLLGPYRGDDLCDKPNDLPGWCNAPDYRNPSERFQSWSGDFHNGDAFLITMAPGELTGHIHLFAAVGDSAPSEVLVAQNDGLMFLEEVSSGGDVLVHEGWYFLPDMVSATDATLTAYNDGGNSYAIGTNVQEALDAVDIGLTARDAWFSTERTPLREALVGTDANLLVAGGQYQLAAGTHNLPTTDAYFVTQLTEDADNLSQVAVNRATGEMFTRARAGGTWTGWMSPGIPSGVVMLFYQADAPAGWTKLLTLDDVMVRVVSGDGGGTGGSDSPILNNKVPLHTHTGSTGHEPAHAHSVSIQNLNVMSVSGAGTIIAGGNTNTGAAGAHSHSITLNDNAGGADWTPKYLDCILCSKD